MTSYESTKSTSVIKTKTDFSSMKALPLYALIILAHFLAGFSALGQATGIRGTVKNIHGEPIPFAAIYVAALHQ
ncbi:MAG: hypothetical protein ACOCXV_02955, partial [Bacteroidota bacterium]